MEPHLMSEARFHCYISLSALQTDCLSLQNYENKLDRSWYVNDFNKNVRKGVLFCPEVLKYKIVCFIIISESLCLVTMGVRVITLWRTFRSGFLFGYKRYPFNRFYHLGARRLSATGRRAIYRRIVSNRSADFGGRQSQKVCFRLSQWWGDTIAATSCRQQPRQETSPQPNTRF